MYKQNILLYMWFNESLKCALKMSINLDHICKQMFRFMFGTPIF
jgi:hypothetical protein